MYLVLSCKLFSLQREKTIRCYQGLRSREGINSLSQILKTQKQRFRSFFPWCVL